MATHFEDGALMRSPVYACARVLESSADLQVGTCWPKGQRYEFDQNASPARIASQMVR
ncbi:hypothetical protein SBA2_50031 [Acidobacteriia bacterium SbA2]|nr:hypothetical protein SBA2_50031 [Acidobacteriia bacterium SbA2]